MVKVDLNQMLFCMLENENHDDINNCVLNSNFDSMRRLNPKMYSIRRIQHDVDVQVNNILDDVFIFDN